jgi:hypothetical protein
VHYFLDRRNGVLTRQVIAGNKDATEGDKTMFNTYAEAQNWIEAGQAKHGKRAFTSRPEYAEAYAEMTALFHAENPNYKKPNRKTAKRVGAGSVNLLAHGLT